MRVRELTVLRTSLGVLMAAGMLSFPTPAAAPQEPKVTEVAERVAPVPEPTAIAVAVSPAAEAAKDLPRLHSLLVSWRGELVLERYFNGPAPRGWPTSSRRRRA